MVIGSQHPARAVVAIATSLALLAGCATTDERVDAHAPASTEEEPRPEQNEEGEAFEEAADLEAPGDPDGHQAAPASSPDRTLVATSVVDAVDAFAEPDRNTQVTHTLGHPTERGVPRVFLVEERADGWLKVLLPVRPNGSTGWIREADVELAWNPYRIDVDLTEFRMTIHREDELVVDTPIGYGDQDTPTPGGRYYITELLRPPDPSGVYGPYAFGLSGFSDVLLSFAGGEGVIGIHGTNEPDSIGSRVSAGCIRVDNDVITEMSTFLPLGTPVTIS
jgi:lipoprotein-anchoring transpeptidase ErfK/SrfK